MFSHCRYPDFKLAFTALLVLDIGSHWFQMKQAGEGEHHKKGNRNPIVKVSEFQHCYRKQGGIKRVLVVRIPFRDSVALSLSICLL